ncbi:DUF4241 domain-containing protein [Streptomyces mirabilis]
MSPRPPDFNSLFAEGALHDFSHFRKNCVVTVRIDRGTDLWLPSGRLVAAEPYGAEANAFVQRVEPGTYPVEMIIADYYAPTEARSPHINTRFDEVAAARLLIRDEPVATWRLALVGGQDDTELADDEYLGYPVDGGMGSFGSPEVFDALAGSDGEMDQLLVDISDVGSGSGTAVYTHEETGTSLVAFRSGGGDGHYATWVGYTPEGEVACFVTDFMTLTLDPDDSGWQDAEAAESSEPTASAVAPADPPAPPVPVLHKRSRLAVCARGSEMLTGQVLFRRQSLVSPSGEYILVYQDDGNLVLYGYSEHGQEWVARTTHTHNMSDGECILQEDGNLVVYNREGHAVWASGTNGFPVAGLKVRDSGILTLENETGGILWTTG